MDDPHRNLRAWAIRIERELPNRIKECKAELSRMRTNAYVLVGTDLVAYYFSMSLDSTSGQVFSVILMLFIVTRVLNIQHFQEYLDSFEEQRVRVAKIIGLKHYVSVITYFSYDDSSEGWKRRQELEEAGLDLGELGRIELAQRENQYIF
ncbi:hypothetical protein [Deinococcus arenicola]|uniref:Uncharacterized protein n=1 Tax=Deinococcus arenicola TaxID=2994950 RepID=A0ABU4DQZ4_9DEIO|nr:hypothetical protein [Deinococcus sp. ZS9-10]MDV6374377.1 hypothetical protein [Deinococcus sp. ZS9-10]